MGRSVRRVHPGGCPRPVQAVKHEWGAVEVPALRRGSRTFALDSRASVPDLHHGTRAIQLASIPGEEGPPPGPPPLLLTNRTSYTTDQPLLAQLLPEQTGSMVLIRLRI
jgi:hypothetical protein